MLQQLLQHISIEGLIWLIPVLPLAASAINWLISAASARLGLQRTSSVVSVVGVTGPFLSFVIVAIVFWILTGFRGLEPTATTVLYRWIGLANWGIDLGLKVDQLSLTMALVVTGVGSLIHLYSIGYMHGDAGYARYFAELNLFLFFMLVLVLADNMLLMFVGWEGVGLCSYLLISFWFEDSEKAKAGKKAFIVNRIGDFGFTIGLFLIFRTLAGENIPDPLNFETLEQNAALLLPIATPICIALFIGACGKSAQIPLYVWLPDAMAGPTPVSALIHAATMVTAGVYMVARLNFLYVMSPSALAVVACVGAATAFFAATIGLMQRDIKKVLAYSTISQLGFMFLAEGVGAFESGIFHLVTHAFFKALLFLGAGSVIHALHGEQDMFKMGGLKKYLPGTFATFFVAALAISGIYPFAGFFSKDAILWEVYSRGHFGLWAVAFITAGLTAFYMFRAVSLVFLGTSRISEDKRHHVHESSVSMLIPLVFLALLSISGGWIKEAFGNFLAPRFVSASLEVSDTHGNMEHILAVISVLWAAHWAFVAWILYVQRPAFPARVAAKLSRLHSLLINKYFIDEIYNFFVVRPIKWVSEFMLWKGLDASLIDNVGVNGSGRAIGLMSSVLQVVQTGLVPHYLFFMVMGTCILIGWLVF